MSHVHKAGLWALAFVALTFVGVETAHADIVVVSGVNNQGTGNVVLSSSTDVTTATGTVGPNNLVVTFTSTSGSGLLGANPSGQAAIFGGTGNTPFTQLTFGLVDDDVFTQAVFNINAATDGVVTIRVDGINIGGGFFEGNFSIFGSGENFFTITAINGQFIESISLTAISGAFEDLRQVRLGGGDIVAAAVPEPGTLALLGLGLAGLTLTRRRKH